MIARRANDQAAIGAAGAWSRFSAYSKGLLIRIECPAGFTEFDPPYVANGLCRPSCARILFFSDSETRHHR